MLPALLRSLRRVCCLGILAGLAFVLLLFLLLLLPLPDLQNVPVWLINFVVSWPQTSGHAAVCHQSAASSFPYEKSKR